MFNLVINFLQVGIYGYTAYSASKFGLRGMAEALQQEIIADNIHVSLIFPPDTETPGFVEGLKSNLLASLLNCTNYARYHFLLFLFSDDCISSCMIS